MKDKVIQILLIACAISSIVTVDNVCTPNADCGSCLKANGLCNWCKDANFTDLRCDFAENLKGCSSVMNIKGSQREVTDDKTVQVRPQKVELTLRPGVPQTFTIKVKPAKNFPVNLYYLMDMSKSMEDDLANLRTLGTKIAASIGNITTNYKLGFGSFVDKTVAPYIQALKKNRPCNLADGRTPCEATFGYKHVFNFSESALNFESAVKSQVISGNLDTPEGGLDGLMQVAVCDQNLQWPAKDKARRIVVFVTDATPHIAGDGKLGGILAPNDGKCHLNYKGQYTKSNDMDYPSVSQVRTKLKENKIVPILAVTKGVYPVYKKIAEQWKDLGAAIGALSSDSQNIVELIDENYRAISQTVRLSNEQVENVVVQYKPKVCSNKNGDSVCENVGIEEEVEFEVTVTATQCPSDKKEWLKDKSFKISIPGFGDVTVDYKLICECPCELPNIGEKNSTTCNGTGTFQCGICYCPPNRYGENCECDGLTKLDDSACKQTNSTTERVCSGQGNCVCGKCVCNKNEVKTNVISGKFCQCKNYVCQLHNKQMCGGKDRGRCECGKCVCNEPYLGDNCGEINCTIADKKCFDRGVECSGHGSCECGVCLCRDNYGGNKCEECLACPQKCNDNKDCVMCQVFGKGPKEICDKCNLKIRIVNDTEPSCIYDDDGCLVVFNFEKNYGGENDTVLVVKERKCKVEEEKTQEILAIVLGTIAGIVLVGLLLLIIWKLIVTAHDKHEYRRFEKDRLKSKWENAENPIYKPSKQEYQNPTYAGAKL